MKKIFLLASISALAIAGCTSFDGYDENAVKHATKEEMRANAESVLGITLDPNHDWSNVTNKTVTITANANMDNIVKVQILTESPLFNEEASVLSEASVSKGQTVTLSFETPDDLTELVAACIDNNGKYYLQMFNIDDEQVSFASTKASTRGSFSDNLPNASDIILASCIKSFNALRAEEAKANGYVTVYGEPRMRDTDPIWTYDQWNDGSWSEDRLWLAQNKQLNSTWKIADGVVFKKSDAMDEKEAENLKKIICDDFLVKKTSDKDDGTNGRRNNIKRIRNSKYFELENNYLTPNGVDPLIITPVQANTTDFSYNDVYYYYFKESDLIGKTEDYIKNYIKRLPKYKAIDLNKGNSEKFNKFFNYLLPFYGPNPQWDGYNSIFESDDYPIEGKAAVSLIIPRDYKVGFLNRKNYKNMNQTDNPACGCTYGDGRLNFENNHLYGHFLSAVDKNNSFKTHSGNTLKGSTIDGMRWEDPRIAMFSVNNKTYMCFEDGSDCTFSDMIIEISSGIDILDETIEVFYTVYTMCYEDREKGDYDMNDVVIKAMRLPNNQVLYSIEACGAHDELYIHNINGQVINSGFEIHELFGVNKNTYVNTVEGGVRINPIQEIITVDDNFSFTNPDCLPYIENKTMENMVYISKTGDDPHGIVIPCDYNYPTEQTKISDANEKFLEWASDKNSISSKGWYRTGNEEMIYTQSVFENNTGK